MVLALFCELILIKFHTNVNYDNMWDKYKSVGLVISFNVV